MYFTVSSVGQSRPSPTNILSTGKGIVLSDAQKSGHATGSPLLVMIILSGPPNNCSCGLAMVCATTYSVADPEETEPPYVKPHPGPSWLAGPVYTPLHNIRNSLGLHLQHFIYTASYNKRNSDNSSGGLLSIWSWPSLYSRTRPGACLWSWSYVQYSLGYSRRDYTQLRAGNSSWTQERETK